jgi:hypothetical protein
MTTSTQRATLRRLERLANDLEPTYRTLAEGERRRRRVAMSAFRFLRAGSLDRAAAAFLELARLNRTRLQIAPHEVMGAFAAAGACLFATGADDRAREVFTALGQPSAILMDHRLSFEALFRKNPRASRLPRIKRSKRGHTHRRAG